MAKFCAWDEKEIVEEIGSIERREFRKDGKDCYYFCNNTCEVLHIAMELKKEAGLESLNTDVTSEEP
jgi:hypothetical protein